MIQPVSVRHRRPFWAMARDVALRVALLTVLLGVVRVFVVEPYRIPSSSMLPTLQAGDRVLVTKFAYGIWLPLLHRELFDLGDPQRGDVIVFRFPADESVNYIKRVIAVPGDAVKVVANRVFLNGVEQPRNYAGTVEWTDSRCRAHEAQQYIEDVAGQVHAELVDPGRTVRLETAEEWVVPPGRVFVLGDNRDHSSDSRRWGLVRFDQVKGRAWLILLSWDGCRGARGLRVGRFFRSL